MSNEVLFISDNLQADYMSDIIFHGMRSILKENLIDANRIDFMYDDYKDIKMVYGKGFTLYGKLDSKLKIDRENIEEKIKNKYFKNIIYGSVFRKVEYFDIVKDVYKKEEIFFIDGEDWDVPYYKFIDQGIYFKRELEKEMQGVHPIQFAVPKNLIIDHKPEKETPRIGTVIPNNVCTYVFKDEKTYYEDYAKSYFGITCKKAGWDCMRHYEIMMNYCFPYFKELKDCPPLTMFRLPKKLIIKAMEDIEFNRFDYYDDAMSEIMDNLVNKLTTEKMAQYLLEFTL